MSAFEQLEESRKNLICHRATRALVTKLKQEHIAIIFAWIHSYLKACTLSHKLCDVETQHKTHISGNNMGLFLFGKLRETAKFDWWEEIVSILKEEGVPEPLNEDVDDVFFYMMGKAST